MNILTIRHRTASTRLGECWEYDPAEQTIVIYYDHVATDIPVCTEGRPRDRAFYLRRISESEWQVAPAMAIKQKTAWVALARTFDDEGKRSEFLMLSCAPPEVCEQLEQLF